MVEYRLYYDDIGAVVCYTTEVLEGNFIVIDKMAYITARHDVRVVDNKLIRSTTGSHILKLIPTLTGTPCYKDNILVIDDTDPVYWDLRVYDR
jgi:hypothetical protein